MKVWSATFGAYCVRGHGITTVTAEQPELVQAVHRLAQTRKIKTPYLTFQITQAPNGLVIHRDGANAGPSDILACGPFKAGHLMVETNRGKTKLPAHFHSSTETEETRFTKYQIKRRWLRFLPTCFHAVSPPEDGIRVSITLYTPKAYRDLSDEVMQQLRHLGFYPPIAVSPSEGQIAMAYPTEARIRAKEKKLQGIEVVKRVTTVEQHVDDMGADLSGLGNGYADDRQSFLVSADVDNDLDDEHSSDDSDDYSDEHGTEWMEHHFMLASEEIHLNSHTTICTDMEELQSFMQRSQARYGQSHGIDVVELCGGSAMTTSLAVKAGFSGGRNFDLLVGINLNDPRQQQRMWDYFRTTSPLLAVMAPTCRPFGGWSHYNRVMHPTSWQEAMQNALPHAILCSQVAMHQITHGRYFAVEQPSSSDMWDYGEWPKVLRNPAVECIEFHQCMLGLVVENKRVLKPTVIVSNSPEIIGQFEGLRCDGRHEHLQLQGRHRTSLAEKWPHQFCQRLVNGLRKIKRWQEKRNQSYAAGSSSASAAVGPPDRPDDGGAAGSREGAAPLKRTWNCPACRKHAIRTDPAHNRDPLECKYPEVQAIEWSCPGCIARRPRWHADHVWGPGCRWADTPLRMPRGHAEPRSAVPRRHKDATARLGPAPGAADEKDATAEVAEAERDLEGEVSVDDDDLEAQGPDPDGEDRRGRGPDRALRHQPPTETAAGPGHETDWSNFDIHSSLRGLRVAPTAAKRRILRRLHLRWWHASTGKMMKLLRAAGIATEVLQLIPAVVETCTVCRSWQSPGPTSMTTSTTPTEFNQHVEMDLVFIKEMGGTHAMPIALVTDRCTRWIATTILANKEAKSILSALDQSWVALFGPPQHLHVDGETGLDGEESDTWMRLRGIRKHTLAPSQHPRIGDAKAKALRDIVHRIGEQLHQDGHSPPFQRVIAEATFASNAMTTVGKATPYQAVLGRTPPLLPSTGIDADDSRGPDSSVAIHRTRELALQQMVEQTARDRILRARKAHTRVASQQLALEVGQEVEYWRETADKDVGGWRGPATVTVSQGWSMEELACAQWRTE
eukprot:785004-Amphidinium_carterae.3